MRVLVLGGGVSGRAAADLLSRTDRAVRLYDADPEVIAGFDGETTDIHAGLWDDQLLYDVDLVVASPGISEYAPPLVAARHALTPVWSELELATRHLGSPYVAVTGTNGKTTTVQAAVDMLVGSGVKACAAGNIGTALSGVVDEAWEVVVIEASSFQLRFTDDFHPSAAAILNIAPDHLDWHGSFEAYRDAKARIHRRQEPSDLLVYDADDPGATEAVAGAVAKTLPVSGVRLPDAGWGRDGDELVLGDQRVSAPYIPGGFGVDLVAAAALAQHVGATEAAVAAVIDRFEPGAHRYQRVGMWDGVTWINDSKATNPHAVVAAANGLERVILIAGGRNKGLDLSPILAIPSVTRIVAMGEAAADLAAAAPDRTTVVTSLDEAIRKADEFAVIGDTVLLAPGCASFDMFDSYEHRGDEFTRRVRAMKELV